MTRVDLNAIGPNGWVTPDEASALVAELRAARELVEQARLHRKAWTSRSCGCGVCWALGNYEQTVRP